MELTEFDRKVLKLAEDLRNGNADTKQLFEFIKDEKVAILNQVIVKLPGTYGTDDEDWEASHNNAVIKVKEIIDNMKKEIDK